MSDHTRSDIFKSALNNIDITFRFARQDDLPKLEWGGEYSHFRTVFQFTYQEQRRKRRLMLLADYQGFPVGHVFILLKENSFLFQGKSRRGYLYSLRVMESFQRRGIGTELLRIAERVMLECGLRYATIAAARDNPDARRLYERSGYRVYSEDEGRWSYTNHEGKLINVHEPCWLLEKSLV